MDQIVKVTNAYKKSLLEVNRNCANLWYLITRGKIYLYFTFMIYVIIILLNKIEDYWNTKRITLFHIITKVFLRDRFQELRTRFRVSMPGVEDTYNKVKYLLRFLMDLANFNFR